MGPALAIDVAFFAPLARILLTLNRGHAEDRDANILGGITDIGQESALILGQDMFQHLESVGGREPVLEGLVDHVMLDKSDWPSRVRRNLGVLNKNWIEI